jgi:hypothetical protein
MLDPVLDSVLDSVLDPGLDPTWPARRASASAGSVDGRNTRMVPQSLPQPTAR